MKLLRLKSHIWDLKKKDTNELIFRTETDPQTLKTWHMHTKYME